MSEIKGSTAFQLPGKVQPSDIVIYIRAVRNNNIYTVVSYCMSKRPWAPNSPHIHCFIALMVKEVKCFLHSLAHLRSQRIHGLLVHFLSRCGGHFSSGKPTPGYSKGSTSAICFRGCFLATRDETHARNYRILATRNDTHARSRSRTPMQVCCFASCTIVCLLRSALLRFALLCTTSLDSVLLCGAVCDLSFLCYLRKLNH